MSNRFNKNIKTILVASLCFGIPACSLAVDLSATEITSVEGRVEVKKIADNLFKKLHSNLKLAGAQKRLDGGDKVRTYDKSSAEMALKDTCILAVKEQSIFEVPKTLGKETINQLKAQQGALLFKVVTGSNFQVQTADVIAGVKGTLFELDIIDNFHSMLETPGLQIGTLAPGGTTVNVYKGEVELTHKQTGKKRSLKAGEGLAALGSSLMNLDKMLQDGFTPLRKFDPATLLGEKFGGGVLGLLNTEASLSGLASLPGLGNINSSLGSNRLTNMFSGISDKIKGLSELQGAAGDIIGQARELEELGKDLAGTRYSVDFSKYSTETRPVTVADNSFREVYLGNKTFAACKAAAGSRLAKLEPNNEGLQLIEGNSMFKMIKFNNSSKAVEFLASYYNTDNKFVTTINVIKGDLYGRLPGSIEHFKIPTGEMSYVFDPTSGSGEWMQAAAGAIDPSISGHFLKVEQEIAKDKGEHDQENSKKKVDAVKKLINVKPGNLLKRFRF